MSSSGHSFTEGFVPFNIKGSFDNAQSTYFKVFGSLENSSRRPLIVLHGGPGLVHNYLFPFAELSEHHGIPVILYDQIGNGKSSHIKSEDVPEGFWNVDLFIDELENLIKHFNLDLPLDEGGKGFDIMGHSWGGILASEFCVRRQPKGLKHLILTSSLASSELWNRSTGELLQSFSDEVKMGMIGGMKEPEKFWNALKVFHEAHGCLKRPVPEEYWQALESVFGKDGDPTVAGAQILKDWSIVDRLEEITIPTFVINGRKDIAQDFVVAPLFQKIPRVKWVTMENSSHSPFIEETDRYMKLIADFLML